MTAEPTNDQHLDAPGTALVFPSVSPGRRLTHYLFRYPAKFHAPVVRKLLVDYTQVGDRVLDPFCGSGTLLVEAMTLGRHAVGTDIDPVAVFVSRVKAMPLDPPRLEKSLAILREALEPLRRTDEQYAASQWVDLSEEEYEQELGELVPPPIPNLFHWFRRYVVVDLARMKAAILEAPIPATHRDFFLLVFASIIRAASNADPVPVSGLEVTSHMKERDRNGRIVNPYALWDHAVVRAIRDMEQFRLAADGHTRASAFQADATRFSGKLRSPVQAVVTSPPYHGAVDYYRRHQLEMFWLNLVSTHADRLELLQRYVGRTRVAARHPFVKNFEELPNREQEIERQMRAVDPARADGFRHYCVAMRKTFNELAKVLQAGAPALFVVGHSTWNGSSLNTSELLEQLAETDFVLKEVFEYPVKNRYMSYSRRNGASIDREYVLVFRRLPDRRA